MNEQHKTQKDAASMPRKFSRTQEARIARWRNYAEARIRNTPKTVDENPFYVDHIKTVEIVSKLEGMSTIDYVLSRLIKRRIDNEANNKIDDDYEKQSTRARNSHDCYSVTDMFLDISFGLPKPLSDFSSSEIETLTKRFYRRGDGNLHNATIRAMLSALNQKGVAQ